MALTLAVATWIKHAQVVDRAARLIAIALFASALGLANQIDAFDRVGRIARTPAPIGPAIVWVLYKKSLLKKLQTHSHSYSLPDAPSAPWSTSETPSPQSPGIWCTCPFPCRGRPDCDDWS